MKGKNALRLLFTLPLTLYALHLLYAFHHIVEAGEGRDPFVFGPSEQPPDRGRGRPILTGIVWDAVRPLAVVDGEPVMLGQTVAGWQIVEIQPGGIVVQQGAIRDTLEPGASFPQN